jgi:hypothetical protein
MKSTEAVVFFPLIMIISEKHKRKKKRINPRPGRL